jgi:hypothetical protein
MNLYEYCDEYNLTETEKKTVKQIVELLNGENQRKAKEILSFCGMVIDTISMVSVEIE